MKPREIEDLIRQAKKELTIEQIKQVIRDNTCGGTLEMRGGASFGKTNT